MQTIVAVLAVLAWASPAASFVPVARPAASSPSVRALTRMQTIAPEGPTITKEPSSLPDSWVVPDTFSLPKLQEKEEPMYRVTLFKSSSVDVAFMTKAIMQVVGYDEERAAEIADKAQKAGMALVGVWVQEVAEMYADGLRSKSLVVDISQGN